MSRTGITPLCRALHAHPCVAGFGSTRFFGRDYVQPEESGRYGTRTLRQVLRTLRHIN